jgi:hypothetical protein
VKSTIHDYFYLTQSQPPDGLASSSPGNTQPSNVNDAARSRVAALQVGQLNQWIALKGISKEGLKRNAKKAGKYSTPTPP